MKLSDLITEKTNNFNTKIEHTILVAIAEQPRNYPLDKRLIDILKDKGDLDKEFFLKRKSLKNLKINKKSKTFTAILTIKAANDTLDIDIDGKYDAKSIKQLKLSAKGEKLYTNMAFLD